MSAETTTPSLRAGLVCATRPRVSGLCPASRPGLDASMHAHGPADHAWRTYAGTAEQAWDLKPAFITVIHDDRPFRRPLEHAP